MSPGWCSSSLPSSAWRSWPIERDTCGGRTNFLVRANRAEAECSVLPRSRRVAGWAAYGFAGLLNCLFLGLAFLYAKRWGWAVSLAAWALWFALFIGAIWLGEWCWQPYRAAQARLRQKQTEIRRALEGRANEEDSARSPHSTT